MATNENLPPNVLKHLAKELKNLNETPPEGIKVSVSDDNFAVILAEIEGPVGTPYESGVFCMKLILSHEFPQSPPKGYFLTKIFHPNIATNGEICVNALKKDWNPGVGLRHVLMVIRCLLIEPFPESALNEQAGKMLLEDYDQYARYARLYTGIHAKTKAKFKVGAITESTKVLNVDQTNPLVYTVDQKNAEPGAQVQSPPPFGPSNAMKGGNSQVKPTLTSKGTETVAGAGVGASVSVPSLSLLKQKEVSLTKVHANKKKIDARTKSLKRL